jgi:cyclic pyranopterin phosphate synthase
MESGRIHMIDVTQKEDTKRQAVAECKVKLKAETLELIRRGGMAKGDVLTVAQTAGILAAKETPRLIPLCHPLLLTNVAIEFNIPQNAAFIEITATAKGVGKTGFEMEALVAVSIAALNIYDMCKAVDKTMTIEGIRLVEKSGGRSGLYAATDRRLGEGHG